MPASKPEQEELLAGRSPNSVGAEESEQRRRDELAGQKRATEQARRSKTDAEIDGSDTGRQRPSTNADKAKENERLAEEEGRELPG